MYITKITLTNVRSLKQLTLPVDGDQLERHTILVGANSTCKTTILRCIAIGLCNETQAAALLAELPGSLVGPYGQEAVINISLRLTKRDLKETSITTRIRQARPSKYGTRHAEDEVYGQEIAQKDSTITETDFDRSSLFVCGYGAGRGSLSTESWTRYRIVDSVYTLFRYDQPLQNPELILFRLGRFHKSIYQSTIDHMRRILQLSRNHRFELTKSGIIVSGPKIGKRIPLDAVADGYKLTFSWLCDLIGWAMIASKIDKVGKIQGIILVDELEQHIHPSWQTELLPYLKRIFPDLQVIATSHSSLVALSAKPDELFVLRRKGRQVDPVKDVPDFTGYSAEDMLTDERIFDSQVYSTQTNRKLREYRKLAAIPKNKRTQGQEKKLRSLAQEIRAQQIPLPDESPLAKELKSLRNSLGL